MNSLKYWQKQEKPLFSDLSWNIPEQKSGKISIIGGNSQNFSLISRLSAKLSADFPVGEVISILPDSLRRTIPPVPGIVFCPSTDSGGFAKSSEILQALQLSEFSLLIGDFGKNSETSVAIADAVKKLDIPTLITRDSIDLLLSDMSGIVDKENILIFGSLAQLQKVFRAVYYPKVLLLSMPIIPIIEALHKFTLSYPCTLITLHEGQILVAHDGKVISTKLDMTDYSPLSIWDGRLAINISAMNLYNPGKPLEATVSAITL